MLRDFRSLRICDLSRVAFFGGNIFFVVLYLVHAGLRRGGLMHDCGSAHARNGQEM